MKIAKENLENYEVQLTIEVEAERLGKAKVTAAKNLANRMSIPGFRKGKAPLEVIERHVGKKSLMDEAAETLIQEAANEALKDEDVTPVSEIKYDVVTNEEGQDFVFKMTFTPYPKVTLGEYKGLTIEKKVDEVTDEDVQKQIDILLDHHATLIEADPDDLTVKGDFITLDFDGFIDGKEFDGGSGRSHPMTLGSGTFIPGFEDQLIGLKAGQEVEVKVKFPEDYHSKKHAGKDAVFKCKVLSIKHRQLPELNDEFVKKISTFETVDAFKANVRRNMIAAAERAAVEKQKDALLDAVANNIVVDIPPIMIENQITQLIREQDLQLQARGMSMAQYMQLTELSMDEMRDSYRDAAERSVRVNLMLEEVADAEHIEVDNDDYRYEVAMLAATYNIPPKEIQKIIRKENQGALLISQALRRKVLSFLIKENIPESAAEQATDDTTAETPTKEEAKEEAADK